MKRSIGILCGLVFASLSLPAQAQDYYASDGGLYWSVRGGLSQVRSRSQFFFKGFPPTYTTVTDPTDGSTSTVLVSRGLNDHRETRSLEMDYGYVAGASIGYTVAYPRNAADLRFEVEGIYRRNDDGETESRLRSVTNNQDSDSLDGDFNLIVDGHIEVRSIMLNVMADFHTSTRIIPYIGLGVGASNLVSKGSTAGVAFDDDLYVLSWQGIAGIGYHLSPGTVIFLESRYFRLAGDRNSELLGTDELRDVKFDDWSMGLRFTF